jgi:hypothetical protein
MGGRSGGEFLSPLLTDHWDISIQAECPGLLSLASSRHCPWLAREQLLNHALL